MIPPDPPASSTHLVPTTGSGQCCSAPILAGDGERIDDQNLFLSDLRDLLRRSSRVAILAPHPLDVEAGCWGWGRTSACRQFAAENTYRAALFLSGANDFQFRYSLWRAASQLDLPEQFLHRGHDVVAGVRYWLQTHSDWLLVVDDAADLALLSPLLRDVAGGHVVVVPTSNGKDSLDPSWSSITIPPLSDEASIRLLASVSGRDVSPLENSASSKLLLGNPLTLRLAGSLRRCGVPPVLEGQPAPQPGGLMSPLSQVVRQSLEHLRTSSPGAVELLAGLIHFSSGPIDRNRLETAGPLAEAECWDTLHDIGLLRHEGEKGRTVSIPAAVSDACLRSEMLDSDLLDRGLQLAVERLPRAAERTPLADFALGRDAGPVDDWALHRASLADLVVGRGARSGNARSLLRDSAEDALALGALTCSLSHFEYLRCLAVQEAEADPAQDPAGLNVMSQALEDNAAALIAAQRYQEGRRMLRQAAEQGTPSPLRITSILLAIIELDLYENRLERAASRLPLTFEWCGHLPAETRTDGSARLAFLAAATALGQGRLPDAGIHLAECRRLRESQCFAPDHPEMHRLRMLEARVAFVLKDVGRSESILREDLRILAESRTASESQRTVPLSLLADLLYLTGQSDEALAVHERLLATRRMLYGVGHRLVAEAANRLAVLLGQRGRFREAEPLFAESLAATSDVLGTGHPEVARVLNDYAEFLHSRGRYEQAETFLRQALEIQEKCLRVTDPRIARTRNNLAAVHVGRRQFSAAERLYREDVLLKRHGKGTRSPLSTALNNLGETLRRQGKWGEAEAALREALDIRIEELGESHPHVAQSRSNLANLYLASGNLPRARAEAERALDLRRARFEAGHPSIGVSLQLLAEVAIREGRSRDAHAPLLEACDLFGAIPDSPHFGGALFMAGQNSLRLGKRGRGELLIRRAIEVLARTHGTQNPVHARALVALAELQIASRQGDAARTLLESAMPPLEAPAAPPEFRRELGEALLRLGTILSPDQACRMISLALPFLSESPRVEGTVSEDQTEATVIRRTSSAPKLHQPQIAQTVPADEVIANRITDPEPTLCGSVFDDF